MRPLKEYYDISKSIALPQLASIRRKELSEHAAEMGSDYLGTSLAACLYSATNYVHAPRMDAQRAGLALTGSQIEQLSASYAYSMTERMKHKNSCDREPANVFAFPDPHDGVTARSE